MKVSIQKNEVNRLLSLYQRGSRSCDLRARAIRGESKKLALKRKALLPKISLLDQHILDVLNKVNERNVSPDVHFEYLNYLDYLENQKKVHKRSLLLLDNEEEKLVSKLKAELFHRERLREKALEAKAKKLQLEDAETIEPWIQQRFCGDVA
ncbi:hypothetical protein [Photobacterium kasasachensis]|uniref:hypothetical protein n=1 Tax=Photobacterium kasasachensis TaxID=2910240 RepID=UPI003D0CEFEA